LDFAFIVLLNAVLYIRPAECIPFLLELPIYQIVLAGCLLFGFPSLQRQLSGGSVAGRPISVCVLGLAAVAILSNLAHFSGGDAYTTGDMFFKILLYYLLLAGTVSTPQRLRKFVLWLVVCDTAVTAIAVLHYYDIVHFPNVTVTVDEAELGTGIRRLGSTGLFSDPNDIGLMLAQAIILCFYLMGDAQVPRLVRVLWVGPLLLLGQALRLTYSRGALLALVGGVVAFLLTRFGKKAVIWLVVVGPVVLFVFAGRQARFDINDGTGQARIHLWDTYMELFVHNPAFGVGCGKWEEYSTQVAHNSFLQTFGETGFLGGMLLLGAFYFAVRSLYLMRGRERGLDPVLARFYPYLVGVVACQAVGMLSLSRGYAIPTYTVLGLTTAYLGIAGFGILGAGRHPALRLAGELMALSVAFLWISRVFIHAYARYFS
jgi:hypothetical protein